MPAVPSDEEFRTYNVGVISEFRANHGKVSRPPFPVLLLTTTGARTGRQTTVPLGFGVDDRGRVLVVGSKAGAPKHPAWFHNLRANPSVTVELGDSSYRALAVVTAGEERDHLYRIDDFATCTRCKRRFDIPSHQSMIFLDEMNAAARGDLRARHRFHRQADRRLPGRDGLESLRWHHPRSLPEGPRPG